MSKRKLPRNLKLPLPEFENENLPTKNYRMIRLKPIKSEEKKEYVTNQFEQEKIIYNNLPQDYKFKYSGSKRINATTKAPR
jgi:hypothetical protein